MPDHRPTVLILSTNPGFAREVAAGWPADSNTPLFTVLEDGLCRDLIGCDYHLAIAEACSPESYAELKQALFSAAKPAIMVCDASATSAPRPAIAEDALIEIRRDLTTGDAATGGFSGDLAPWATLTGLIGREVLQRSQAEERALEADANCAAAQAEATLGRYMVEMRLNANNALTSVLGNAELLTQEPGLPAHVLAQADTVRNMALRLHEIFQRFSSIEKELSVTARELGKRAAAARAGSRY